jgi:peptidoglycan/LPS O-acetylase OafA/YrhL
LAAADLLLARIGVASPAFRFAVALALTVAGAEISFRFWEAPFLKLKDRLSARAQASASDAPSQPIV